MIPLGALCLIVRAPTRAVYLGRQVKIINRLYSGEYVGRTREGQYVQGPSACFMVLDPWLLPTKGSV